MRTTQSLRERLQTSLRIEHEELDLLVTELDLTTVRGLCAYLRLNHAAFASLQHCECNGGVRLALHDLHERALHELKCLNVTPLSPRDMRSKKLSPLAIEYVVGGSRLGSTVLRRRWETSPLCSKGASYMAAPDYLEIWRGFLATASSMPGQDSCADKVVEDARQIFGLFSDLATESLEGTISRE